MNRINTSFKALLSLFLILAVTQANAQDLIKTSEGEIIKVRLIDVNDDRILYKNWEDIEGEDQTMDSDLVDYVRYERSGSADKDYDESEYDYDPLVNHNLKYLPTEDVFYVGVLGGVAQPIGYYNIDLNNTGYYTELFLAYDFRGYNRIKLDLGYMHIPSDEDVVRQTILNFNPQLSADDLLSVKFSGDKLFYASIGSTNELFFNKWSINLNPRLGIVMPRDRIVNYELSGAAQNGKEVFETRFGFMNGLAVNARYRLSKNMVVNGAVTYWDGFYEIVDEVTISQDYTGVRTLNVGFGISYSIPY